MDENRKFRREKKSATCEFSFEGKSYAGFLIDLSARGLFIQSTFVPPHGRQILVSIPDPIRGDIELGGRVVRTRSPHREVARVIPRGFGVALETAPPEYFDLLLELGLG
jgi:hypothetical protein